MIELIYRKFQFLVVRLKVGAQDKTASRVGISIPCGSIKRKYLVPTKIFHAFQFLVVRLKAIIFVNDQFFCLFQFLVVRLKES